MPGKGKLKPSSQAQRAVAHSPKLARKIGMPPKVAKELRDNDPGGKLPKHAKKK